MQGDSAQVRRFSLACAALAGALAAYHLLLVWLMRTTGLQLGVVSAGSRVVRLVPLYMHWAPHVRLTCLPAAIVLLSIVCWIGPKLVKRCNWPAVCVALLLVALQLAVSTSVGIMDGGLRGLARPYAQLAATDYIGGVARVESPRAFLRDYPRLIPSLPMHCQTHPPGAVLFLWAVAQLFGAGTMPAALSTVGFASLTVPAVYLLARRLLDEPQARLAGLLFLLAPSVVLFSATCMDAVFAVPLVWAIYFVWSAAARRPLATGAMAGLMLFAASLMTFSVSLLAAWALVLVICDGRLRRERAKRTCLGLVSAAAVVATCYAVLHLWSGYDPLATLRAAVTAHHRWLAGVRHETFERYAHLALANIVAFFAAAGIGNAVLCGNACYTATRAGLSPLKSFVLSFAGATLLGAALPLYALEVEHIWLFLVPWVAIAAASQLPTDSAHCGRLPGAAVLALALAAVQTFAMELLLHTHW